MIMVISIFVLVCLGSLGFYLSTVLLLKNFNHNYGKDPSKLSVIRLFHNLQEKIPNERFTISSPLGYELVGYNFPAKRKTKKTIITVHGYTGSKDHHWKYVEMFHRLDFNVVVYDHRNHGESGGNFISYGMIESMDLQKIVEFTKEKFQCEGHLGIHGVSMGAATTLLYAGNIEDSATFYIVDCPYSDLVKQLDYRMSQDYPFIPAFLRLPIIYLGNTFVKWRGGYSIQQVKPIKHIHRIQSPMLFINTKKDKYIPPFMTGELYQAKRGMKSIYWTEEGDHAQAFDQNPFQYQQEIEQFLSTVQKKQDTRHA